MRSFSCPTCQHLVFFENFGCLNCGTELGYSRTDRAMVAASTRCANATLADCNWVLDNGPLCGCCAMTRTRPADSDPAGLAAFARTEAAKRRLVFQLDELGLPTDGMRFDLLSSTEQPVTTGHADGVVTIDLAEGDDPHREALRVQLAEPYRTLLGHLRHEIGHWYWTVLVQGEPEPFRALFGDERADYAAALERHYGGSPPAGWEETAVSTCATAHPWEDWAETFAHYLHIRDTLESAAPSVWSCTGPPRSRRTRRPRPRPRLRRTSTRSSTPGCR